MTKMFSLLQFIAELPAIERDVQAAGPKIVEQACKIVQARARRTIGTNQEMWAPLAESTIADKARRGYATPKPLLRTGEMKDSIQYTAKGLEGCVGSDLDRAYYQEMGTAHMPPRSFLRSAAIVSEDRIRRMATAAMVAALSGHGRHAHDVREMLHLLHKAGHALRELGSDLVENDDEAR